MAATQRERSWQALIRKEESSIRREEKLETVERINKAQAYNAIQIATKIEKDAARSVRLAEEKKELFDMRLSMRRDADKNKAKIMTTLESLKSKGEIKPSMLTKLGINPDRFSTVSMMRSGSAAGSNGASARFNPNASTGDVGD